MPYDNHHHHHHHHHHSFKRWLQRNKGPFITACVSAGVVVVALGVVVYVVVSDSNRSKPSSASSTSYVSNSAQASLELVSDRYLTAFCNEKADITVYYGDDQENMANNKKMDEESGVKSFSYITKYNGPYFIQADFGNNDVQRKFMEVSGNYTAIFLAQVDDKETGQSYIQFTNNDFKPNSISIYKGLEIGNEFAEYESLSPNATSYPVSEDGWYTLMSYGRSNYGNNIYFSAIHVKNCLKG